MAFGKLMSNLTKKTTLNELFKDLNFSNPL